jgi:hypothetical protein
LPLLAAAAAAKRCIVCACDCCRHVCFCFIECELGPFGCMAQVTKLTIIHNQVKDLGAGVDSTWF